MSRTPRRTLAPALGFGLSLLAGACADHAAPTDPAADAAARSARSARSGSEIDRSQRFASAFGGQPEDGLAVFVGSEVPIADVCADPEGAPRSPGKGKLLLTPPGGVHIDYLAGEAAVTVFRYGAGIVTDFCQLVGAPIVATGRVSYKFQLSDPTPANDALVIHLSVHGVVELTDGGRARLFGMWRQVVRPDGTLLFDEEPVRLTPL